MSGRYRTIVADPPWQTTTGPASGMGMGFTTRRIHKGGRPLGYRTMSVAEMIALPVAAELAAEDCALYLWTTSGFLRRSFDVLAAWGFTYSTTLVWGKTPMGSGLGGCWGISTEFILYGRRGSPTERYKHAGTALGYGWKRVYTSDGKPAHSAKPPAMQDLVEAMHPGPYLEMFARSQRLGWDTWGDEALEHVTLAAGVSGAD
jgi:N6-adenosine-specific RNA methylase IME4